MARAPKDHVNCKNCNAEIKVRKETATAVACDCGTVVPLVRPEKVSNVGGYSEIEMRPITFE